MCPDLEIIIPEPLPDHSFEFGLSLPLSRSTFIGYVLIKMAFWSSEIGNSIKPLFSINKNELISVLSFK